MVGLLGGALAVGAVPGVGRAVSGSVVECLDRARYVGQALDGGAVGPTTTLAEAGWTATGVVLGLLSTALAIGLVALALSALSAPVLPRALWIPARRWDRS